MRCDSCNYNVWDYSENYETCWLGIEPYENSKGSCGCKYRRSTLEKWGNEIEEAQNEEYKRMGEYFSKLEEENETETIK